MEKKTPFFKTPAFLVILIIVLACLLIALVLIWDRGNPAPTPSPGPPPTQPGLNDQDDGLIYDNVRISLYMGGLLVRTIDVADDAKEAKAIIDNVIIDYMIKSIAFPAVDMEGVGDRITISLQYPDSDDVSVYHAFQKDGVPNVQIGNSYASISQASYASLLEFALGFLDQNALTITAGGESIRAISYTQPAPDPMMPGDELLPKAVAPYVERIRYAPDFIPAAGGEPLYGMFRFFDENDGYHEIEIGMPSGLEPWAWFTHVEQGTYIVEYACTNQEEQTVKYYFGLIIDK